ncbi:glycoside hydrolase family 6 protein [Capnocytophaga catalasegens]|uniref:Glucanase n=1 Tax=Capnocytophaga catalasegens TaxID=1004260 RepID=A0AAV5AS74_9FLAO|nr:glycoside hydrolase family 6 protein [Capnocytophaga catalasegens]GIZ14097.1 glucanase [Capnocytophaga catalasegens]GJM49095.1 glucanase [Capnocytophaga catalasegens]GJM52356.1 glucanase [Capnocytophaga catalasegens]
MLRFLSFTTVCLLLFFACKKDSIESIQINSEKPEILTPEKQKPIAYDWDFYLQPSRLYMVKNEPNIELKKIYYQIAATPCGDWFDGVTPNSEKSDNRLKNYIDNAEKAQKTPIVVVYGIPNRDCGSFSAGGHKNATDYKAWINRVSNIIGQRRAVVIIEPDAINYCGLKPNDPKRIERAELLTYAGKTISERNKNAVTYIHAGSSGLRVNDVANTIIESGVKYMRGFATNVSGVRGTKEEQEWAEKLVQRLGELGISGKHYVIDTGRSGIHAPKNPNPNATYNSCNNFAAALGPRSTKNTTGTHADAYLWINGGGGSDGACGMGAPAAGQPYPEYARALVNNAIRVGSIEILELPNGL